MSELKIVEKLFKGRHFDREVIILCVRWYLRFKVASCCEQLTNRATPGNNRGRFAPSLG